MPLFRRPLSRIKAYNFIGDEHSWRKLVTQSISKYQDVYLCDSEAMRELYPKEVKVIKSNQTAKRVEFLRRKKTIVFIGKNNWKNLRVNWSGVSCLVLRCNLRDLADVLTFHLIEISSRPNISFIRKYK